jgi:hypothetical protein
MIDFILLILSVECFLILLLYWQLNKKIEKLFDCFHELSNDVFDVKKLVSKTGVL